jgi:hypothetical protein
MHHVYPVGDSPVPLGIMPPADRHESDPASSLRGVGVPDDLPLNRAKAGEARTLCIVVIDRAKHRGQALSTQFPSSEASVLVASSADQLSAITEYVRADAVVLSAADYADALEMLPAVQGPLACLDHVVPLICHIQDGNRRRGLRSLLLRLGVTSIVDGGPFSDDLLANIRTADQLLRRARLDGGQAVMQRLVETLPQAHIMYEQDWSPVACNNAAWQLVHQITGGRKDGRTDRFVDLFTGDQRVDVQARLSALSTRGQSDHLTFTSQVGTSGFGRRTLEICIEGFRIENRTVYNVRFATAADAPVAMDSLAARGVNAGLAALRASTATMRRVLDHRQRQGESLDAGGIDEGDLLAETEGSVALVASLCEEGHDPVQLLRIDALAAEHLAQMAASLGSTWRLEWSNNAGEVVTFGAPNALRRVLTLMVITAQQEAQQRHLLVTLERRTGELCVRVNYRPSSARGREGAMTSGPRSAVDSGHLIEIGRWVHQLGGYLNARTDADETAWIECVLPLVAER